MGSRVTCTIELSDSPIAIGLALFLGSACDAPLVGEVEVIHVHREGGACSANGRSVISILYPRVVPWDVGTYPSLLTNLDTSSDLSQGCYKLGGAPGPCVVILTHCPLKLREI
jgi:hypothetical protein